MPAIPAEEPVLSLAHCLSGEEAKWSGSALSAIKYVNL